MDGFMNTSTADVYAIGYYREADNQCFPQFARNFTACDLLPLNIGANVSQPYLPDLRPDGPLG
jgi:hypothetical protein